MSEFTRRHMLTGGVATAAAVLATGTLTQGSSWADATASTVGSVPAIVPAVSYQQWAAKPIDQSSVVNAALASASANYQAGNGQPTTVALLGAGYLYGSFEMYPGVELLLGPMTVLAAMPAQTSSVLDYHTNDAYFTRLVGGYLFGNLANGAKARCLDMTSSNDSWPPAYPFPNAGSPPAGSPEATGVNNPGNFVDSLRIGYSGGDYAAYIGLEQRNTIVSKVWIHQCAGGAIRIDATDSQFHNVSAGVCGDGFYITGGSNKLTACKSYYHGVPSHQPAGPGDGFRLTNPYSGNFGGGNELFACESQDNYRYGYALVGAAYGNIIRGTSGGDTRGAVYLGAASGANVTSNDVVVSVQYADRGQENVAVVMDGSGGPTNVTSNLVRVRQLGYGENSGWVPVQLLDGGTLLNNDVQVSGGADEGIQSVARSGTWNPNPAGVRKQIAVVTGNLTIGPATTNGWRDEMTIILQDSGGGNRKVNWDLSWSGASPFTTSSGKRYAFRFVNVASTTATASWLLVSSVGPV